MSKRSPVAVFLAASALLTANALQSDVSHTANCGKGNECNQNKEELLTLHHFEEKGGEEDDEMGGLKEWNTDQSIDDESTLDEAAQKAAEKAKEKDYCIPIGEGENCW